MGTVMSLKEKTDTDLQISLECIRKARLEKPFSPPPPASDVASPSLLLRLRRKQNTKANYYSSHTPRVGEWMVWVYVLFNVLVGRSCLAYILV